MATHTHNALMRRKEVEARTKLCRASLYAKLNPKDPGHDASFPVPIRIGASAVRWIESEVDAWITSRPRTRVISDSRGHA